ncbi:MAG: hypothetical protein GY853_01665 [PVC group bacterium]|nr:hypothetical protein [PVC group bacterium]
MTITYTKTTDGSRVRIVRISYNGVIYGAWDEDANINYPEDLTLERDLSLLVEIGVLIGRQMERDEPSKILPL